MYGIHTSVTFLTEVFSGQMIFRGMSEARSTSLQYDKKFKILLSEKRFTFGTEEL